MFVVVNNYFMQNSLKSTCTQRSNIILVTDSPCIETLDIIDILIIKYIINKSSTQDLKSLN